MVVSEFALAVLIFVGIMAITALLFGGWAVVSILKGMGNALFGAPRSQPRQPNVPGRQAVQPAAPPQQRFVPSQTIAAPMPMKGVAVAGAGGGIPCQGHGCRQVNPNTARFCRRCGHPISQVTAAAQKRVAMW